MAAVTSSSASESEAVSKAKAGVSMYIRMHCVCYGAIPQVKRVKKEDGDDDDDEFKVCVEKDWSGCWLVVQKRRGMNE